MRKKNRSPHSNQHDDNSHHNQATSSNASSNQALINHLNRIINTQDRLNEVNFDLDSFLNLTAQQVHYLTSATGVAIELTSNENLYCRIAIGSLANTLKQVIDKNNSISGLCMNTHQIIRCDDIANDSRFTSDEHAQMNEGSLAIAPIFSEGNTIGVVKIVSNKLNAFSDIDIQTLHVIAGLITTGITHQNLATQKLNLSEEKNHALDELRKSEKKIKHLAQHDYLTGLPNRILFNHHLALALAKAKRRKQLIALMYLDIDHFAQINEILGHSIGDELLHAFGQRLKQCIRASDLAARFGGDEFIMLIDDIKESSDAIIIADKILHAIRQPFNIQKNTLNITTSIGIAFLKDKEISGDDLLKQAYQALYVSKNSGRNTFYIFDNDLLYEHSQT